MSEEAIVHSTIDGKYAAIYTRVSTEDQGNGFSIPLQIEASQKVADRKGYTVAIVQSPIIEGGIGVPGW